MCCVQGALCVVCRVRYAIALTCVVCRVRYATALVSMSVRLGLNFLSHFGLNARVIMMHGEMMNGRVINGIGTHDLFMPCFPMPP